VPGHWLPASSCQAAPESPTVASAVDGNWTQKYTDQDHRQVNEQGPIQKPAMDKDSKTLVILPASN